MGRVNIKTDKVYPIDYMFKKVEEMKQLIDNDLAEKATKDYVNSQILTVNTGGEIDLSYKADIEYVEGYNNNTITYGYYPDGSVQTVTEKDSNNVVIKTTTYIYNASGDVTSSATVMDGKTVTTTYTYDVNGNITSTSNVVS